MVLKPHDIEADLTFLTAEQGGRQGPVRGAQYHPNCDFGLRQDGSVIYNDVRFEFTDREWVQSGGTVHAKLWFLSPEFQVGRLYEGFAFDVCEGTRIIAKAIITKVCNESMIRHRDG